MNKFGNHTVQNLRNRKKTITSYNKILLVQLQLNIDIILLVIYFTILTANYVIYLYYHMKTTPALHSVSHAEKFIYSLTNGSYIVTLLIISYTIKSR